MKTRISNFGPHTKIRTRNFDGTRPSRRGLPSRINCASGAIWRPEQPKPPVAREVASFAPATIANFGPGFDWLGCAVEGDGDVVIAKESDYPGVIIETIEGDGGKLSMNPRFNCIGIAAYETLRLMNRSSTGVSLALKKAQNINPLYFDA